MEPNPGLSIPSIGTPLYHLEEEDQQFLLPNSPIIPAIQRQQQQNAFVLPHQQISTSQNNVYSVQGFTPQHHIVPAPTSVK